MVIIKPKVSAFGTWEKVRTYFWESFLMKMECCKFA